MGTLSKDINMFTKIIWCCLISTALAAKADPDFAICDFSAEYGGGAIFIRQISHGIFPTTTEIFGKVNGLAFGLHGIHIHEFGELGNGCLDAGGHFDPDQTEDTTGEYVGDLGSLNSVNSGSVAFRKEKSAIKLSGSRSVMNRSIVVHADPTGGDRIMCCTIKEYYSP